MSVRRRVVPFVTAVAAVATFGSGCGLTEEGPRPGLAAEVAGETLTLDRVDEAVQDYCALRAVHPEAVAAPRADVRAQFVLGWMQAVGVERLAGEYDVPTPPEAIDRAVVQEQWGELGEIDADNYDSFEWLTWIQLRLTSPVEILGSRVTEEETGEAAVGQPAVDRGVAVVQEWLADNDPEINPQFGELDVESGLFAPDQLSVPVSTEARSAAGERTDQEVGALPPGERCGPAAPTDPSAPVGQG